MDRLSDMNSFSRRTLELILLGFAFPPVALLFIMLYSAQSDVLGILPLAELLLLIALFLVCHFALRKWAPDADPVLLPLVFFLCAVGIAFVTRLAPNLIAKQLLWLILGIFCFLTLVFFVRRPAKLAEFKYTFLVVGLALLLSPLLPGIGLEFYGSRIWLDLGFTTFQPGEFAKLALIIFLAGYLAQNREMLSVFTRRLGPLHLPDFKTLLPILVMLGLSLVIVIFEKDLGSALLFFFIFLVMLSLASGKKIYLFIGLLLAALAGLGVYFSFDYIQARVLAWLAPFDDPQGTGYQIVQSLFSLADGDLFGCGIGNGLCTLVPLAESDFIFTAIAEETGFLGATAVLIAYLALVLRSFTIAARAKSDVSALLSAGLSAGLGIQVFLIVGGVTGLIPLTGITTPFLSQGGTSLIANFVALGLITQCSNEAPGTTEEMELHGVKDDNCSNTLGRVALGRRLTFSAGLLGLLFTLLIANLGLIMIVRAQDYLEMPANNHVALRQSQIHRGSISTADGTVLAISTLTSDGTYLRVYPAGTLATHVIGYYSPLYGTAGIEDTLNDLLQNQSKGVAPLALDTFRNTKNVGNDVVLTLNTTVQLAAQQALEGYSGACIVLDPSTGATYGLASAPTYSAENFAEILGKNTGSELYNRATQALFAPGSTFKMVTLAAALEDGISANRLFDSPATISIGGAEIINFAREGHGSITLARATEVSSNTVYAQVGILLGPERLVAEAEAFLFNTRISYELPVSVSLMPDPAEMTDWETAWSAAGEPVGEHESPAGPQVTLMQMALVGCAVANGGTLMQPYLVSSVFDARGVKTATKPSVLAQPISPEIADQVAEIMRGVVTDGTAWRAGVEGAEVYAKTGTAERDDGSTDSWFVGFADVDGKRVVVALVLQDATSGTAAIHAGILLKNVLQALALL